MRTLLTIALALVALIARPASFDLPDYLKPSTLTPYWQVGVRIPGEAVGIPYRPNWTNALAAGLDNSGVTPIDTVLSNLVQNCPLDQAIYFPDGVYKLTNNIILRRAGIVIRGQSQDLTLFRTAGDMQETHAVIYGQGSGFYSANNLSSGYTRGSSNVVCATTNNLRVGSLVVILEDNDPAFNFEGGGGSISHAQNKGQYFTITAMAGTTATLDRPISVDFSAAYTPIIKAVSSPQTNTGLETFTLDMGNTTTPSDGIWFYRSQNCWVKDVTVTNTDLVSISIQNSRNIEVRGCRVGYNQVENSSRYGVQVTLNSTGCLIEDNIGERTSAGFIVQQGANGNVIGYNFFGRGYTTFSSCLAANFLIHGDAPFHNLFVRNKGSGFQMDDVWGGGVFNTILGNSFTGINLHTNYPTDCRIAFREEFSNPSNAFVFNFQLRPYDAAASTNGSFHTWETETSTNNTYVHGNHDFQSGVTTYLGGTTNTLTTDFYHTSKPGFLSSIPWMFDPGTADLRTRHMTNVYFNAAEARYYGEGRVGMRLQR